MDSDTIISIVRGAVLAGILVFLYPAYRHRRLRAKRLMLMELLKRYFRGDVPADQLGARTREIVSRRFVQSSEFYSLAIAAFQGAADAKFADQGRSEANETRLLRLLAALKKEFGLPDRYQIEQWRPGRE